MPCTEKSFSFKHVFRDKHLPVVRMLWHFQKHGCLINVLMLPAFVFHVKNSFNQNCNYLKRPLFLPLHTVMPNPRLHLFFLPIMDSRKLVCPPLSSRVCPSSTSSPDRESLTPLLQFGVKSFLPHSALCFLKWSHWLKKGVSKSCHPLRRTLNETFVFKRVKTVKS